MVSPGRGDLIGNLDEAALWIGAAFDPSVVVADQLERLDQLAARCNPSSETELAQSLFGGAAFDASRHFAGNTRAYYEVDNSLLPRVLDRRLGIPITLSLLLIEIGRRCSISLHGVGMPGHFLVGFDGGFIDPYHRGQILDAAGCRAVFASLAGPDAVFAHDSLEATPAAVILRRILVNLAGIGTSEQNRRVLWIARSLLAAFPDATFRDHIQHAFAAAEVGRFDESVAGATRALPDAPGPTQEKLARSIAAWQARLN